MQNKIIIIQARMGSTRYPGKTLHLINSKPVIEYLLDSLKQIEQKTEIIIATSTSSTDDEIYNYCIQNNIKCYRGSEDNVASRFYQIVNDEKPDFFIRVCADSPFLDFRIVEEALNLADSGYPIVSTVPGRLFPSGMNVEMIESKLFVEAYKSFSKSSDFEHVTSFFYENDIFNVKTIASPVTDFRNLKFSFDTEDDLKRIVLLVNQFKKPHFEYTLAEKCELLSKIQVGFLC